MSLLYSVFQWSDGSVCGEGKRGKTMGFGARVGWDGSSWVGLDWVGWGGEERKGKHIAKCFQETATMQPCNHATMQPCDNAGNVCPVLGFAVRSDPVMQDPRLIQLRFSLLLGASIFTFSFCPRLGHGLEHDWDQVLGFGWVECGAERRLKAGGKKIFASPLWHTLGTRHAHSCTLTTYNNTFLPLTFTHAHEHTNTYTTLVHPYTTSHNTTQQKVVLPKACLPKWLKCLGVSVTLWSRPEV